MRRAPQPAVAFFNVGELAVDALVATLGLRLVARLGDPNLLAVVGNDAYDHTGETGVLATALEMYSGGSGGWLGSRGGVKVIGMVTGVGWGQGGGVG